MRDDVILEDTTLRDGEQAPGVAFDRETKVRVHDELVAAGVRWIEAGIPAMGGDELAALKQMLAADGPATLVAWNRGVRADVEASLDLGFTAIHIGLPSSDVLLQHSVGRDRAWLLRNAREVVAVAKDRDAFVSVSAEDVGRVDLGFLAEYAGVVHEAGADRLRLSDTIGILTPERYAERVRIVREAAPIDVHCHTHNDFGLGIANTLAGLEAGARYFHVTVNGMGERAGIPDLAVTVMALKHLHGVDVGIDTSRLRRLSRLVADAAGQPMPPWQPIVGDNVFAHESGIHVKAMLEDASSFEPLAPEEVGGDRRYVLGKHSGRALVREILSEKGVEFDDRDLETCLREARALSVRQQRPVDEEQILEIFGRTRPVSR
jgi:homocitrate synthase NifV